MKRPLLRVALFFVAGIIAADRIPLSPALLLGFALCWAVLTLVIACARPTLLCGLAVLAGWGDYTLHTAVLSPHDLRTLLGSEPQLVTVRGALVETPTLRVYEQGETPAWRTLARIEVTQLRIDKHAWQSARGRIAVATPGMLTNLFGGQTIEVTGVALLPRIATAEGTFDYRAYLRQQGIYYQMQADSEEDWTVLQSPARPPLADRFREWARAALARGLPVEDESLRLEWALTLGWKPALTKEVSEPFVRAATYHIFAVDGLRMAIIFGIFFGLLRAVNVPRAWCGLGLLPLLWFYVALTGWPASAIRATVMASVVIGSWVLRRPSDILNSLFCAALLILVWEPQQIFQAGFQLSFFVVLCLILTLRPLFALWRKMMAVDPWVPKQLKRKWPEFVQRPAGYLGEILMTSFAAWIGSIPLVAYYFHIVTPVSTPANLVAVPLCGLVLVSNLASLLVIGWFPAAAVMFNHAGWFWMECIRVSSYWFAGWPKAWFYVPAPSLFTTGLYYGLLLGVLTGWLLKPAERLWKIAVTVLACSCWSVLLWHNLYVTRLTVLPVNGGTSIYCDAPRWQHDLLVDTGGTNAVQFVTKPFLQAQGMNTLRTLLLTHGDLHHVGGAQTFAADFATKLVCASPVRARSASYRKTIEHFKQPEDSFRIVARNDSVGLWTVLHPDPADRFPRADDNAIVLQGMVGPLRVLLLSDLGRSGQEALMNRTSNLRADIVVAGLPANGEPVCDALLDAMQPRILIVADSEFPASERASAALRARLAQRKFLVIYTRFSGAVTIDVRSREWELRTMAGDKIRSGSPID